MQMIEACVLIRRAAVAGYTRSLAFVGRPSNGASCDACLRVSDKTGQVNPHIKKNCLASPMRRLRRIVYS